MEQSSFSLRVENIIRAIGDSASWFCLLLIAIVCASVLLRYVAGVSSLAFDELQWHIYSASWLLGFSYATTKRSHVRNDILFNKFSKLTQARIDLYSHLLLVLPFVGVILYHSWSFVEWSYLQNEGSIDPDGLPGRWVIKSVLLIGFFLFCVASLVRVIDLKRVIAGLKRGVADVC